MKRSSQKRFKESFPDSISLGTTVYKTKAVMLCGGDVRREQAEW